MGFVENVTKTLTASFKERGITMEQVLLRNVLLPDQITKAINDKIAADQDAQKMAFVLQKEKQEAERKRIEAEGQAKAQQIVIEPDPGLTPQIHASTSASRPCARRREGQPHHHGPCGGATGP
jgi:tetrahydromethanopterin S-methyltransferase subunit A